MTFGLRRTSSGVPSAIFSPWSRTVTRSLIPMTTFMSCSMRRTVSPSSVRSLLIRAIMSGVSRGFMPAVGSSSSRSFGLAAERAGDLEPALVAVRQVLGELAAAAAQADEREQLLGPARGPASSRRLRGVESIASSRWP